MHPIFSIQELLCFIFDEVGSSSQVSCALVCKAWCEIVLSRLWRVQDSPEPLVSLLRKLHKSDHSDCMYFHASGGRLNWVAFDKYAHRVRHLVIDLGSCKLDSSVFNEIVSQKRPGQSLPFTLLPNLSTLKVIFRQQADFKQSLIFANPSVKKFHLSLPLQSFHCLPERFVDYAGFMPNLSILEIDSLKPVLSISFFQHELAKWISALKHLEHFTCAPYFATSAIVSALLGLPSLKTIVINSTEFKGSGQPFNVMPFRARPPSYALVDLQALSFCATLEDASELLETICAPRLRKIVIGTPNAETAESIHGLLSILAKKHSSIEEFTLDAAHFVRGPFMSSCSEDAEELDRVTFQILEPLQELTELRALTLSYHRSFQLSYSDLGKLVTNFPNLSTLDFCAEPILAEKPTIMGGVLPTIARHCPRISALALYMDTRIYLPSPPSLSDDHRAQFPCIKQIRFGASPITEADVSGFAFYLSTFLPSTCKVDALAEICWIRHYEMRRYGFRFDEETPRRWSHVSSLLKVLSKTRAEEDVHSRLLNLRTETLEI